jgi:gluconolactonase
MKTRYLLPLLLLWQCAPREYTTSPYGSFEALNDSFHNVVSSKATIEKIGEGYEWSEGPVWIESQKKLLFSDVPKNTVYQWQEGQSVTVYLTPSGYTGEGTYSHEPGSNGLLLDGEGRLVLCQHGNRQLARMDAALTAPAPNFTAVAANFNGKRFNSPNDAVFFAGDFFFTDPPYGLPEQENDSTRELTVQGVYRATASGEVHLLVDSLTRPNGIAFFPDGKSFLVANSDPAKAKWYRYEWNGAEVTGGSIFYNATAEAATERGLPDGLKIDRQGRVFATGPGGIWVFDSTGQVLGKIRLNEAASNCALSTDEKTLFVTNDMLLLKISLRS